TREACISRRASRSSRYVMKEKRGESKMRARAEVKIACGSYADAEELALRLRADGYRATHRFRTVIARTSTAAGGEGLLARLRFAPRSKERSSRGQPLPEGG